MIRIRELEERAAASPLGRASPLLKLAVAFAWLAGLVFTSRPLPPLLVTAAAAAAAPLLGGVPVRRFLRTLAPLAAGAVFIGVTNTVLSGANADPLAREVVRVGPLRIVDAALATGLGIGLRVVAIGATGACFVLTTDATTLIDALVQQARAPARFAYATLAVYGAVPRIGEDMWLLRAARRVRGLRSGAHPRLLVALLVLGFRRADRMALALDARGFGIGPRTSYRERRWAVGDLALGLAGSVVLAAVLVTGIGSAA